MTLEARFPGIAGGTLSPTSGDYIVRPADSMILEALRRHEFCYVLSSRQMGKSSLLARAAATLRAEGWRVVPIDMTMIGTVSCDIWYQTLCQWILDGSDSALTVSQLWRESGVSEVRRFCNLISALAEESEAPLAILLDEIDSTIPLPFTDDFFASLRSIHNERAYHPELEKVVFALAGVAAPHDLIKDKHRTPFNIGQRIDVSDFTFEEAARLLNECSDFPQGLQQHALQRILYWTGGQPYLTHLICRSVTRSADNTFASDPHEQVDRLVSAQLMVDGNLRRDSHLSHVAERLKAYRGIGGRRALQSILLRLHRGRLVSDDPLSQPLTALKLAGIVRVSSSGMLRFTNEVYRRTFSPSWVRTELRDLSTPLRRAAVLLAASVLFGTGFVAWIYPHQLLVTLKSLDRDTATARALHGTLCWFPWQRPKATQEYVRVARNRLLEEVRGSHYAAAVKTYRELEPWDVAAAEFVATAVRSAYHETVDSTMRGQLLQILSECGIVERDLQRRHLAFVRLRIAKLLDLFRAESHAAIPPIAADNGPVGEFSSGTMSTTTRDMEVASIRPAAGDEKKLLLEIGSLWDEQVLLAHSLETMDFPRGAESPSEAAVPVLETIESETVTWEPLDLLDCLSVPDLIDAAFRRAARLRELNDLQGLSLARQHLQPSEVREVFHDAWIELVIERTSELAARERSDLALALLEACESDDTSGRLRLYESTIRSERKSGLIKQFPSLNGVPFPFRSTLDIQATLLSKQPLYRSLKQNNFSVLISGKTIVHFDHLQQSDSRCHRFRGLVLDVVWHPLQRLLFVSTSDGRLSWYKSDPNTVVESIAVGQLAQRLLVVDSGDLLTVSNTFKENGVETLLRKWSISSQSNYVRQTTVSDKKTLVPNWQSAQVLGRTIIFTGFGRIFAVNEQSLTADFTSDWIFDGGHRVHCLWAGNDSRCGLASTTRDGSVAIAELQLEETAKQYNVRIVQELCPSGRIIDVSGGTICVMPNDQTLELYEQSGGQYRRTLSCPVSTRLHSCAVSESGVAILDETGVMEILDRRSGQRISTAFVPQARHLAWHDPDALWICGIHSIELWDHRRIGSPVTKSIPEDPDRHSESVFSEVLAALRQDESWKTHSQTAPLPETPDATRVAKFSSLKPLFQQCVSSTGPEEDSRVAIQQICSFEDPLGNGSVMYCAVAHDRDRGAARLIFLRKQDDRWQYLGQRVFNLLVRRLSDSGFTQTPVKETGKLLFAPQLRHMIFVDPSGDVFGATPVMDDWNVNETTTTTTLLQRLPLRTSPAHVSLLSSADRTFVGYASGAVAFDQNWKALRTYSFPFATEVPAQLSLRKTLTGEFLLAELVAASGRSSLVEVPIDGTMYERHPVRPQSIGPWEIDEFGLAKLDQSIEVASIPLALTQSCFGLDVAAVPGGDGVLVVNAPQSGELQIVDLSGKSLELQPGVDWITGFQHSDVKSGTQQLTDFVELVVMARNGQVRVAEQKPNREMGRVDSPVVDLVRGSERRRCRLQWNHSLLPTPVKDRIK
jgi:hypothetical protein